MKIPIQIERGQLAFSYFRVGSWKYGRQDLLFIIFGRGLAEGVKAGEVAIKMEELKEKIQKYKNLESLEAGYCWPP